MAQNDQGNGTRTSSRCITEGATHDFEVSNHPLLDGMGIGKYISSGTFTVAGYDWNIRLYPNAVNKDSVDHASVYLCYLSQANDKVRTKFALTMLDDQGNIQETRQVSENIFSTGESNKFWGFAKFVNKSKLKSSPRFLTIRCALTVIKEPPKECKSNLIVIPPPELPDRLERTFKDGKGTDVTLLVGGSQFSAHRIMLAAQSSVFDAQLFGPMMDNDARRIDIVDMEPVIFEMLLHYVYTDSLPRCSEDDEYDAATMQHLLVAADRYGIERLKVMCEEKLSRNINVQTVTSTLALANHHFCKRLMDACLEFISSSSRETINAVMPKCPILDLQNNLLAEKVPIDQGDDTRTSSRCIMEGVTHDFEVTNYLLLDGMGIAKYISSGTFTVGGYDWNIRLYPDGNTEEQAGHASVYLCYLSQANDKVRTSFTLTMLYDQGNAQATKQQLPTDYIFSLEKDTLGFPKFIEKSELKSSRLLTIRCDLTVIKEPPAECKSNLIVIPPPELPCRLERTFKDGKGTDVTLLVGGSQFSAHRIMLAAQSPVFDAQLFGPMMDNDTRRIEVIDMEPAIFEMLLHYVYTDSLPPCSGDAYDAATMQHLLVAADRYGMERLKVMCEEKLSRNINVQTVTSTLALANHHFCKRLMDACLGFISSSSREVINKFMPRCPILDLQKNLLAKKVPTERK